ncbi:unnamed protein product, partial [Pylaiella littoralis]
MTARPDGAVVEGEEDAIFDEPMVGDELEGLMGEPPSVSNESALALIKEHATTHPETIRDFIANTAARLAIESGCVHEAPLVLRGRINRPWQKRAANTSLVSSNRLTSRQIKHDGASGYLLAKRVRNQSYYDTLQLLCVGQGNQCPAGASMIAALKVFAGQGENG